jgi:hypothetical protein
MSIYIILRNRLKMKNIEENDEYCNKKLNLRLVFILEKYEILS